jgi:hypothetical protein
MLGKQARLSDPVTLTERKIYEVCSAIGRTPRVLFGQFVTGVAAGEGESETKET